MFLCCPELYSQVSHLLHQEQERLHVHLLLHWPFFLPPSLQMCSVHLQILSSDRKARQVRMVLRPICHPLLCPCDQVSCRCPLLLAPLRRKEESTHQATIMQPPLKSGPILPLSQELQVVYHQELPLAGPPYLQNLRSSIRKPKSPDLCRRRSEFAGTRVEQFPEPRPGLLIN